METKSVLTIEGLSKKEIKCVEEGLSNIFQQHLFSTFEILGFSILVFDPGGFFFSLSVAPPYTTLQKNCAPPLNAFMEEQLAIAQPHAFLQVSWIMRVMSKQHVVWALQLGRLAQ